MKRLILLAGAVAVMATLVLPAGAAPPPPTAGPKNPSFEQGFTWWTVDAVTSGGSAAIIPGQVRQGGSTRYAQLTAESAAAPTTIDQTFNGNAGLTVTGFARFNNAELNGECTFVDTALVSIDGNPVFQADSCTTGDTGGVVWTYVLTSTGSHDIHGEVLNGVDTVADSSLDMDAPLIAKVP